MEETTNELHKNIKLRPMYRHNYPAHMHKEIEMIFMIDGDNSVYCNGVTYELPAGSILLVPPNTIHAYNSPPSRECYSLLLIVDPSLLSGTATQLLFNVPKTPVYIDRDKKSIAWQLIQQAHTNGNTISKDSFLMLISTIIAVVLDHMELVPPSQEGHHEQSIIRYCQEHYMEPITIEQMAADLSINKNYISRYFSQSLNISFPNYLNGLRLKKAISLLKNINISILDVAAMSGFGSLRSFNRYFAEQYGMPPNQYRKLMLNIPANPSPSDNYVDLYD